MSLRPPDATNPTLSNRRVTGRRLGCLLLVALPVALVVNDCLVRPLLNPLRRSPASIERELLERTPPGTMRAEVEALANAQGWPRGGNYFAPIGAPDPTVQRRVGEYQSFGFTVKVFARWEFGPDGRLESIEVYKWVADAL